MNIRIATLAAGVSFALSLGLGAAVVPPSAIAAPTEGHVIAQDTRTTLQVTLSAPRELTVLTKPNALVHIKKYGDTRSTKKRANGQGVATFSRLIPGQAYIITAGEENTTATPEITVTPVTNLTVMTTDSPTSVSLTWKHSSTRAQGAVAFIVRALPLGLTPAEQSANTIESSVTGTSTTLVGLNPTQRFEFSVTPHNAVGSGEPSIALMTRSLNEINGITAQDPDTQPTIPVIVETQRPVPVPTPPPAPQPTTKTIYVCPEGFNQVGGLCTKTLPYTFTTQDYTYHSESRIESCTGADCPGSVYVQVPAPCNVGTSHGDYCTYWTTGERTVNASVKDAIPAGFSDNGSQWIKKDPLPAGYADNGSEWVATAPKEARVVPA